MINRTVRTMVSLAALVAASLPAASHAGENPALDLCVQMFVKEVIPAGRPVEVRQESILASVKAISATRSNVMLLAQGEIHGKQVGRASCVIDRNGTLVSMYLYDPKSRPNRPSRPKVLARNIDANGGARTAYADDMKPF